METETETEMNEFPIILSLTDLPPGDWRTAVAPMGYEIPECTALSLGEAESLFEKIPFVAFQSHEYNTVDRGTRHGDRQFPLPTEFGQPIAQIEIGSGKPFHEVWNVYEVSSPSQREEMIRHAHWGKPGIPTSWIGRLFARMNKRTIYGDASAFLKIKAVWADIRP